MRFNTDSPRILMLMRQFILVIIVELLTIDSLANFFLTCCMITCFIVLC